MKKILDFLSVLSSVILLLTYLNPSKIGHPTVLYVLNVIKLFRVELVGVICLWVIYFLVRKLINSNYKRDYYYLKHTSKLHFFIVPYCLILILALPFFGQKLYYFARARAYYYNRTLDFDESIKYKLLSDAMDCEDKGENNKALEIYHKYQALFTKNNENYRLGKKIESMENQRFYSNLIMDNSLKETDDVNDRFTQYSLSCDIAAFCLNSDNFSIKASVLAKTTTVIKGNEMCEVLLKSIDMDEKEKGIEILKDWSWFLFDKSIKREMFTGKYGKPQKESFEVYFKFLKSINPTIFKKYVFESWQVDECRRILHELEESE